jgi:hypothetical protein
MVSRLTDLTLLFVALFAMAAAITAIDSAYKNAPDSATSMEDQALDGQIKEEILKIEKLQSMKNLKSLHMSPQQTRVRWMSKGECLEIDSHAENHETPRAKSAPIDYKVQNMQLCFSNDKLSRIASAFTVVSQQKREITTNNFVHKDPTTATANEIVLVDTFNDQKKPVLRVGDLENTVANPLRISFKRDYYLPHLRNTTYILQRTFEMHKQEAVKMNTKTVNQYMNYTEQ